VFEQKNGGAIWEGTVENGIARFQNGDWSLFGRAEGLPPGQVRGFFENGDMPGVAVSDYGIFAWTGHRFRKLPSLPRGYISTPVRMGDGTVLVFLFSTPAPFYCLMWGRSVTGC